VRFSLPAALAAVTISASARAQESEATVRAVRDAARVEAGTRFATAVDLRERGALAESVGGLLDEAPGVHVRRMGDGFAPQSVTLRGAPGAHVTVALDGVPLNDAASDGVDLALVPPSLLERADVYRGGAPMRLGVSGLGGALELITRRPRGAPAVTAAAGYGSFGARRAMATVSLADTRGSALAAIGYRGTDGDFPYDDDRGTPRLPGVTTERRNNAADAVDALARACLGADPTRAPCALAVLGWRDREVPGPGSQPAEGPRLSQHRALLRLSAPFGPPRRRVDLWGALIARRDVFSNVGPVPLFNAAPFVSRADSAAFELGATAALTLGPVALEPVVRARRESFAGSVQSVGDLDTTRWSALVGLDATLRLGPLQLVPAAGLELLRDTGSGGTDAQALVTARLGAAWAPLRWLELRANVGHFERAPTLPERFGDRGFVRGNPLLRPERALNADVGAVLRGERDGLRGRVEVAAYLRDVRDLIALVQVNRSRFQPFNVGAATVRGVEAQLRASWRDRIELTASYALTDARAGDAVAGIAGRAVPGVPTHDLFAAVTGRWRHARVGAINLHADVSYVSAAWLEETNLDDLVIPARTLVGASFAWTPAFASQVTVTLSATNLLDARTVTRTLRDGSAGVSPVLDFLGYPLPGRALFAAVSFATDAR
jgi:outer membrane receptor protein involved in Fe transport